MKILLVNDTSDSPNWGARATSFTLKKMIADTGDHSIQTFGQNNILDLKDGNNFFSSSKDLLKLVIPPIVFTLRQSLLQKLNYAGQRQSVPRKWEDFENSLTKITNKNHDLTRELQIIQDVDLVMIQGEGCIHGNTFHSRLMLFWGYVSKKIFNKPVIIVNHTADFSHPDLYEIAKNIYPLFDDIVFRDPISARRCNEFCNGRIGTDAAFLFEPINFSQCTAVVNRDTYFNFFPNKAEFDPEKPYLCIGGGSGLPSSSDDRYNTVVANLSNLITFLQKQFSHQIVLTVSGITDQKIFRYLSNKHNLPLLGLSIPVQQAVDILGNAKAYIGGRWHPSIFSLSGGVPVIPFSANTFKMEALTEMFGLENNTIDPVNIGSAVEKNKIGDLLSKYLNEGSTLRASLKERYKEAAVKATENVSYLREYTK